MSSVGTSLLLELRLSVLAVQSSGLLRYVSTIWQNNMSADDSVGGVGRPICTLEISVSTGQEGGFHTLDYRHSSHTFFLQLVFMIIELVIGVAIGFIPCQ